MSINDSGKYRTTRELVFKAFDHLPQEVRQALANAHGNYVPQPFLTDVRRGDSAEDVASKIKVMSWIGEGKAIKKLKEGTYGDPEIVRIGRGRYIFGPDGVGRPVKKARS
jgi:hypothetical protein